MRSIAASVVVALTVAVLAAELPVQQHAVAVGHVQLLHGHAHGHPCLPVPDRAGADAQVHLHVGEADARHPADGGYAVRELQGEGRYAAEA